ncbi:hypothetical protein IW140_006236 [Coemansia sp. RSA 1813]|nr:hypothetical protein EV178_006245 [Coemansia sp. RSA 1646]KAJ1765254.1 hypothetical protein LPJ74_006425 [Coemansia sp. RSA 1843]KAJ2085635.1 hypothetical protein IW138_006204 [Coemansia sp. RSA 986]KAJ2210461.1 hypothetical protein EV179_006230 [Coemansia sp. RSA 487]KAJ2563071.1 hypothetical protein IW140_006236 [Coemansia sp. RSA 1813]
MSLEKQATISCTQQCEQSAIAKDVAECLKSEIPAGETLVVRVIHTSDHPVDSLTPRRTHSHFNATSALSRRVLILVSRNGCFVAGLEVHEFVTVSADIPCSLDIYNLHPEQNGTAAATVAVTMDACIQKIDTTGELTVRMPLARSLVAGYVYSLRRYRCVDGISNIGVYLFARAQPEYLFAKSQQNRGKHTLNDMALIKWWQGTIQSALMYAMSADECKNEHGTSSDCKAYCVIPGAAASEAYAPWFLGSRRNTDNNASAESTDKQKSASNDAYTENPSVRWAWGLPYPDNARAHDCVLQFPDDPMTRLLSESHSSSWSVAMLLEMLSVSEECGSGHRTAYISASLPTENFKHPPMELLPQGAATACQGSLSFDDYDDILVALFDRNMDFSDTKASLSSTTRLNSYLDSKYSIQAVVVKTFGPSVSQRSTDTSAGTSPSSKKIDAPKVNDLTMMVRKKRKVT